MRWLHESRRREVSLLAAGVLDGEERVAAERHAAACTKCGADLAALRDVLAAAARDEACSAEPTMPVAWLRSRVEARLDEAAAAPRIPRFMVACASAAAAAGLVAALLVSRHPSGAAPTGALVAAVTVPPESQIAVSDEALDRMERTMARERTARYLDEAQDVLVTVSGAPQRCHRKDEHVDMADESRRSRELLARRSRLDLDGSAALTAGPVLDDVERVLREVASLENCARRQDVEAIHRAVERERLIMKIDLMTRELAG